MGEQVRVAVVGVSGIGMAHLFATSALTDEYQLTAVCDVDAAAAESASASFKAEAFTSLDALLGAGVADAVVLAVPPFLHGPMTMQALEAGLHVYCEKPLAPTCGECDDIAAASAATGLLVQVGCQHRFQRSYVAARELLASGELGPVFRANLVATDWFRAQRYFDVRPWRGDWQSVGGGVLLSQAIHQLDAFVWLVGMPERVVAEAWRSLHEAAVEDEVTAIVRLPGGGRATIVASTVDPIGTDRMEIHCAGGSLLLEGYRLAVARLGSTASALSAECPDEFPTLSVEWDEVVTPRDDKDKEWFALIRDTHRDFVAAIKQSQTPRNPPAEATKAVEVANAVYLSALRGEPVDLPLDRAAYAAAFDDLCTGRATLPRVAS